MAETKQFDVLIPFHEDVPLRRLIWNHNHFLWGDVPGAIIRVSDDPKRKEHGSFSPGRARNAAARKGSADWILAYDSDELPPEPEVIDNAFYRARKTGWAGVFSGTRVVKPAGSEAFATGAHKDISTLRLSTRVPTATGLILVRRELFNRAHGYDERFEGWGFEDTALRRVLSLLAGSPDPAPSHTDCWSLSPYFLDLVALYRASLPNRELYEKEYGHLLTAETLPDLFHSRGYNSAPGLTPTTEARDHQRA